MGKRASCCYFLLLIFFFFIFADKSKEISATGQVPARITCYYGQWATYRDYTVDNIPGDKCTHIIYAFVILDETTWSVTHRDEYLDITLDSLNRFNNLKNRYPGLKTSIAVGGGSEGGTKFSQMANDPAKRSTFISSLVQFMRTYSFDGMDIDWEYPGVEWTGGQPYDKANFVTFLRELRTAFEAEGRGWEITAAVSIVETTVNVGYQLPDVCNLLDAVHLMEYDMHGRWNGVVDVHSPLYRRPWDVNQHVNLNVQDATLIWNNAGCPRYKLIVGVPFYGIGFILANANNNAPGAPIDDEATGQLPDDGIKMYSQICQDLQSGSSWTRRFEDIGKCPYMINGNHWVGYEDLESLQYKLDWLQNEGYGGGMVWAIDHDDYRGVCGVQNPLISAMHSSLKDYIVITP